METLWSLKTGLESVPVSPQLSELSLQTSVDSVVVVREYEAGFQFRSCLYVQLYRVACAFSNELKHLLAYFGSDGFCCG